MPFHAPFLAVNTTLSCHCARPMLTWPRKLGPTRGLQSVMTWIAWWRKLYASLINKGIKGGGAIKRFWQVIRIYSDYSGYLGTVMWVMCVVIIGTQKIRWDFELLLMLIRRENETIAAACDGILEYLWVPSRSWSTNSRGSPNGSSLAQNDGPSHKTHKTGWVASRCHCFWWQLTERKEARLFNDLNDSGKWLPPGLYGSTNGCQSNRSNHQHFWCYLKLSKCCNHLNFTPIPNSWITRTKCSSMLSNRYDLACPWLTTGW